MQILETLSATKKALVEYQNKLEEGEKTKWVMNSGKAKIDNILFMENHR